MQIDPIHKSLNSHNIHHTNESPNSSELHGVSIKGQECYIDMGEFYANNISSCMNWQTNPPKIDSNLLKTKLLDPLFQQMKAGGVDKINLSFAQISDIERLYNQSQTPPSHSTGFSGNDSFGAIFNPDHNSTPYQMTDGSSPNALAFMAQYAHQNGIKVDMSFGGEYGGGSDMKLPGDPTTCAKNLSDFMQNTGIDSADFDIENNSLFTQNSPNDVSSFFTNLHNNLSSQGKECTATLTGGSLTDPTFKPLMDNFNSKFDSLNLMLYSNTQYYLSAKESNKWCGVEGAIKAVGGDPSKIHIGFCDSIPYGNPAANADSDTSSYNIQPGSSNGSAAAQIYQQLNSQLQSDGALQPGQSLGEPFVWTTRPGSTSSAGFMQDFYNQLKGVSKPIDLLK